MPFILAPGISFCEADGHRIFLDLRRDRYFALSEVSDLAFTRFIAGDPLSEADRDRLLRLEETGVLCSSASDARPTPCVAPPILSAILDNGNLPAVSPVRALRAALGLRRAKRDVGRMPLDRLCAKFVAKKIEAQQAPIRSDDTARGELAVAFQAAARLVGALDQCLALSMALGRHALAKGMSADLLFGVRARPFHAHAWVQIDGVVVSDRLDNIRPYTPILAL